jgi:putative tryptophan/tyrosine transport system substrate-binding protein
MRRREFMSMLGGAAAWPSMLWPLAAHAQERVRRVGIFVGATAASDTEGQARIDAFRQAMELLGWTSGRNLQIESRWGMADPANIRKYAAELVASAPDVILSSGALSLAQLLQETRAAALASEASGQRGDSKVRAPDTRQDGSSARAVPIVFVNVADPVGAGFVNSLSRPGGNATGFMQFEYSLSAKWLELLKQVAPGVTRAAVLRDAALTSGTGQFAVIQSVASAAGVEVSPINVHDAPEIERAVAAFARSPNGGLVVTSSALVVRHRELIVALAARHKLPAVYYRRLFVDGGGLVSYGYDLLDQFRRAASYVDRILKGEKPSDLPVQAPTKYDLVINLKTAKALGLDVPPTVLARADEVIE